MRTWKRFLSALVQLLIPLTALLALIIFNLFRDISFFSIGTSVNNFGNTVFTGNLISIIDSASELAIIAMGMTLVTAACGGQDISVGAVGAISGAVFVKVLQGMGTITVGTVIVGVLVCCLVTILFKLFNGTLVSVFRVQPMIATLILFSCARSIAYWINGDAAVQLNSPIISVIGKTLPSLKIPALGIDIPMLPTPVYAVILVGLLLFLVFKFTSLRLYTQSVGINQGAARLNGINPILIKLISFVLLGVCVAFAGVIGVCRMGQLNHKTLLVDIEMDAILAVAIGGNSLGGGRFRLVGSVLGAYVIQMLTTTLYAMNVPTVNVKAYKAIVIIIIVVLGSPFIKERLTALWNRMRATSRSSVQKEGVQ